MADAGRPRRKVEGVVVRHRLGCRSREGGGCDCQPGYQAQAFSAAEGRTIRKTFQTLADARAWRAETQVALRRGTLRAPNRTTLREAAAEWLAAAEAGSARTRSGERYKPSALRGYRHALETKLVPALGQRRLSAITRRELQDLVERLVAGGRAPSTVRNAILPLRAIYRRAIARAEVFQNPTRGLELPAVRARRERVARPAEASALLDALTPDDRAIYATALYAGLRRGELRALRWEDVDFERGVIHVRRGFDDRAGEIEPKSRAGNRRVPLPANLRRELVTRRLREGRGGAGLVFTNHAGKPFSSGWVAERAQAAWSRAKLEPIGLHDCRHTYAAYMIAAGVNAKALSTYMGHSSITVTLDRYGHLMPGSEGEAAGMLERFLASGEVRN